MPEREFGKSRSLSEFDDPPQKRQRFQTEIDLPHGKLKWLLRVYRPQLKSHIQGCSLLDEQHVPITMFSPTHPISLVGSKRSIDGFQLELGYEHLLKEYQKQLGELQFHDHPPVTNTMATFKQNQLDPSLYAFAIPSDHNVLDISKVLHTMCPIKEDRQRNCDVAEMVLTRNSALEHIMSVVCLCLAQGDRRIESVIPRCLT